MPARPSDPVLPHATPLTPLPGQGVLAIAGPDARSFLQGQLTQDLRTLRADEVLLGALQTAQGRVISLVRVVAGGEHDCLLLVPGTLAADIATRLARYTLRAKVRVSDVSAGYRTRAALGARFAEVCRAAGLPAPAGGSHVRTDTSHGIDLGHGRTLVLTPAGAADTAAETADGSQRADAGERDDWSLATLEAGEPELAPASAEAFTAHMLNLDLLGGISFSKGCYTGQEIVARTEHLGRVKRRLFRYRLDGADAQPPAPLSPLLLDGTRVGEVCSVARGGGHTQCLAVVALDARDRPLRTQDGRELQPMPLPYAVPD